MTAGAIDRNISITIFVYVPAQQFELMFFNLKLPEGYIVLKVKIRDIANSSPNLADTVLQIRPRAAISDVSFQTLSLARYLAKPQVFRGDRVMPRAQVRVRG